MEALAGRLLARSIVPNPVLVIGTGRSGTTALLRALGHHPRIYSYKSQSPLIAELGGAIVPYTDGPHRDWYRRRTRLSEDQLFGALRALAFECTFGPSLGFRRMARLTLAKLKIHHNLPWQGPRLWACRVYPTVAQFGGLTALFPNLRAIYIVRNPISVVHSRSVYPAFADLSFATSCRVWAESVEKFDYLLVDPRAVLVRQEDLASNPRESLASISDFLGLKPNPGPADFLQGTLVHPLAEDTRKAVDVSAVFRDRPNPFETWTSSQQATFREVCGPRMVELGYEMPS